jgi:hypothetical protein
MLIEQLMLPDTTQENHAGLWWWSVLLVALSAALLSAICVSAGVASGGAVARQARQLKLADNAHLRYQRSEGSLVFEEGSATGALSGHMRARLDINATFTASFTLYVSGGTLTGHGSATPHGSGRYESFGGSLVITGGTGRYAHAHGHGGLYGVFDRHTYNVTVQTTGTLSY